MLLARKGASHSKMRPKDEDKDEDVRAILI